MELEFKTSVLKQLKYYKKKNPKAYKMIRDKLEDILNNPFDIRYEKVIKYPPYKRAKISKYRICFKIVGDVVYIGRITDRSKSYN